MTQEKIEDQKVEEQEIVSSEDEQVEEISEESVPELSPQELEIKRLNCLNTRLRVGMIQVGMESLQKDLQQMNRELGDQRGKLSKEYTELKAVMKCPENHEINLETGEFVPQQNQQLPKQN